MAMATVGHGCEYLKRKGAMNRSPVQQAVQLIAHHLKLGTPRQRIIALVCEEYHMEWEQAESFLEEVEIGQDLILRSTPAVFLLTILSAGLVGFLPLSFYIWGAAITGSNANPLWVGAAFIVGAGSFLLILSAYSRQENLTKERYRCIRCGHLANRLGHQEPIFLPRYKAATYHMHQKRLSTRHNIWETSEGQEWDTYAELELSEVCRRCRHIRKKRKIDRQVGAYRQTDKHEYHSWSS